MLSKMILAGSANVLAATCSIRTALMPSQTQDPEAGYGDGLLEGNSAMYGARKYASGKRKSEARKQRIRPYFPFA